MNKFWHLITLFIWLLGSCSEDEPPPTEPLWDIETQGIPKFANHNYIQLGTIRSISMFRSSLAYYHDSSEPCSSMQHFFQPKSNVDWNAIKLYAPVSGTVEVIPEEGRESVILIIQADTFKAFRFHISHVKPDHNFKKYEHVTEGQYLGTHLAPEFYIEVKDYSSEISVYVNDILKPTGRLVSYFDVLTDEVFFEYIIRGATERSDFIISRVEREGHPLDCMTFMPDDPLSKWFILN